MERALRQVVAEEKRTDGIGSSRTRPAKPLLVRTAPSHLPSSIPTIVGLAQGRIPQYRPQYRFRQNVDVQKRLSLLSPILPSSTSEPPCSRTNPTISPALPISTKSGRAEAAQPPLPDPTIVDLRTPSQPDESQNIARTADFDQKWTCRSGSASSPRSYHRRPPNPLAAATINQIRPRTGLHRGYPTKFPIPWIGPKIGLLEPARLPLYIPTIGDLTNPLEEPQIPNFDHVLLPVGGQSRDGVVELSRSATVGKPETRRK